jgi:hypothetical protein
MALRRHVAAHEAATERLQRAIGEEEHRKERGKTVPPIRGTPRPRPPTSLFSDRDVAAAAAAARATASHLLDAVDADVSAAFERERVIGGELRALRAAADRAAASAAAWGGALAPLDAALRDLGDSKSYLEAAAGEVEGLARALERLAQRRDAKHRAAQRQHG